VCRLGVEDLEARVVAGGDDAVADREGTLVGEQDVGPDAAGVTQRACTVVEVGHVRAAVRDHQRPLAASAGLPPVATSALRPESALSAAMRRPWSWCASKALDVAVAENLALLGDDPKLAPQPPQLLALIAGQALRLALVDVELARRA
jgi:hypothetical protein